MKKLTIDLHDYIEGGSVFERTAVRGIIQKGVKYLMIYSNYGDYKFPGGGMEPGETLEQTLLREVKEETGYLVKKESVSEGFLVRERRKGDPDDLLVMDSYYFFCDAYETAGERNLDAYEEEYGYKVVWITLEEAIANNEAAADKENIPWVTREAAVMKALLEQTQKMKEIKIRPIKEEEYICLEEFLYDAVFQKEGSEPLPREVIRQPELFIYIKDFGKPDDVCLVAVSEGKLIGAAWTRIFAGEIKGYGSLEASIPELAVSVKKEFRGQGTGKRLINELLLLLRQRGYHSVSLSVDMDNYACQIYQKLGFRVVRQQEEGSLMLLDL